MLQLSSGKFPLEWKRGILMALARQQESVPGNQARDDIDPLKVAGFHEHESDGAVGLRYVQVDGSYIVKKSGADAAPGAFIMVEFFS